MDKEPESSEEHDALVILTRLAEHLRKQYLPLPVNGQKVTPKWMAKAADSIEQYLNNIDVKSLDAAIWAGARTRTTFKGLSSGICRTESHYHETRKMPWKEIVRKLESENIYLSERTIRDYAKEFERQVMIEEAAESIFHDLDNGGK